MISRNPRTIGKRSEHGYGLLLAVFLTTVLLVVAVAIAPNVMTAGRREQEKEMIWRGKQYARGVKLYYRKMGRFPTSLDDLTKPKVGSIRFMRQEYKDPMNKLDGSWRFIYVGAAGQLIGSLKPPQQNLIFPQVGAPGTPTNAANAPGTPSLPGATPPGAAPGTNPPGISGAPVSADQGAPGSNSQPIPTGDTPTIVGGNIIGVGSKVNKSSIIIYEQAKNYRLFEFIWDPSKDVQVGGQAGLQTGTGLGQVPGQNPLGQPLGQNPQNLPQNPPQNPLKNPQQNP